MTNEKERKSSVGTKHFVATEFIPLDENSVELHKARVRDSSGKPTDQWSDNEIDRGLVTNSPTLVVTPKNIYFRELYIKNIPTRLEKSLQESSTADLQGFF
jgi:hypothetical protein